MSNPTALLRKVLFIDAVTCVAAGLLMSVGAAFLSGPLGLSHAFLRGAGITLLPFAAFVAYVAQKPELSRPQVWFVVLSNAVWVVDSALVLLSGWLEPTMLGYAFVIAQAAAVAVLMELEYLGLRQTARETSSASLSS